MRKRYVLPAAAVCAALVLGPATAHAEGVRQSGSIRYTTTIPGAVTGTLVHFDFVNPENPDQKPYSLARLVVHYPGPVGDTSVPPRCHATDAEVLAMGPDACPPESKLGGGVVISDTGGGGGPFERYHHVTVSDFNEESGVLGVAVDDTQPPVKTVDHTKFEGDTTSLDLPPVPGFPPPDSFTPIKSFDVYFPPYVRDGRAYARTPASCPAAGYWTIRIEFTYRDGVTQRLDSYAPCTRAAGRRGSGRAGANGGKKRHRHHRRHRRHHRHGHR